MRVKKLTKPVPTYPCGNVIARCEGRTLRQGRRCGKCSGQTLAPVRPAGRDGTPKDIVVSARFDAPELRELRRREVTDAKAGLRDAARLGDDMRKRARAERNRRAARVAAA